MTRERELCLPLQVPPYNVSVTVRDCIFGEVRRSETQCEQCSSPQYSLNPANKTCESKCPENANCTGGASVTPLEGFWVSAPGSDSIVACPLDGACKGDRSALQSHLIAYFASVNKASGPKVDLHSFWHACLLRCHFALVMSKQLLLLLRPPRLQLSLTAQLLYSATSLLCKCETCLASAGFNIQAEDCILVHGVCRTGVFWHCLMCQAESLELLQTSSCNHNAVMDIMVQPARCVSGTAPIALAGQGRSSVMFAESLF